MGQDIKITKEEQPLMVTIRCATYNHEAYIRQCLEGFVMQKTNFRFEAIVHDDASTDGTVAIIREYAEKYPDIIKPIYETENQYSKRDGSLRRIMDAHTHGKYVAVCEGDDYWIDPLKLQKQVDFLEGNPEYGMVYAKVNTYISKGKRFGNIWGGDYTTFDDLLQKNTIPTLTVLYRKDLYMQYLRVVKSSEKNWLMGDYPMWLWFAYKSSIAFMPEVIGVYRVLSNSASHSKNPLNIVDFIISVYDIRYFYVKQFSHKIEFSINVERTWWMLIRSILEQKNTEIQLYSSLLKKNLQSLRWRQKVLLWLCNISSRFVYYVANLYINQFIGK